MLQERSYGSVKIISIDRKKLLARLIEISQQICREHAKVVSVRLFGSLARGDHVGISDVDVLIIVRDASESDPIELIRHYYPYFDMPIGTDLLVLDEVSYKQQLEEGDAFISQLSGESILLAGQ